MLKCLFTLLIMIMAPVQTHELGNNISALAIKCSHAAYLNIA